MGLDLVRCPYDRLSDHPGQATLLEWWESCEQVEPDRFGH